MKNAYGKLISLIFLLSVILKILSFQETILLWEEQFQINFVLLSIFLIILVLLELLLAIGLWKENLQAMLASIALLLFFTLVASYQYSVDAENCACFGTVINFSPLETIIKNSVLIAALYLLYRKRSLNEP